MSATESPDSLLGRAIDPLAELRAPLCAPVGTALSRRDAFPHALLVSGGDPLSLTQVASALAAGLLCDAPSPPGRPCGVCTACRLLAAGHHPDLLWLAPAEADDTAGRKASTQIRIESVRQLIAAMALSPHHGASRVAVIEPAEAMNPASANALLKLLEEPPPGNVLLLVTQRPMRLLSTVRSRCLKLHLPSITDSPELAGDDAELCRFIRTAVPTPAARAAWSAQQALLDALAGGGDVPLSATSRIPGLGLAVAIDALARWVHDLARVQSGASPRFLLQREAALQRVAAAGDRFGVLHMAVRLAEWQRHANHPLIAGLTVADLLLEYRTEVFPPRAVAASAQRLQV